MSLAQVSQISGPADDRLFVVWRIDSGQIRDMGPDARVVGGFEILWVLPDDKMIHDGHIMVKDPSGDVLLWFMGTSSAPEGTYCDMLEECLPAPVGCRLILRSHSVNQRWAHLNHEPLIATGTFDPKGGKFDLSVEALLEGMR